MIILLVDDDPDVREMTKLCIQALSKTPVTIMEAQSGTEALDLLESQAVDLITSDLLMPGMPGLEFLARVKEKHPKLPVVMISGASNDSEQEEASRLGASGFLTKPFASKDLIRILGLAVPPTSTRNGPNGMKQVLPTEPITLTPQEVSTLYAGLRALYHDLNNSMTVISGACTLGQEALGQEKIAEGKRMFAMLARTIGDPNKILKQVHSFGSMLENHLKIEEKPDEDETSARIGVRLNGHLTLATEMVADG